MNEHEPPQHGRPRRVAVAVAVVLGASVLAQVAVAVDAPFAAAGQPGVPALLGFAAAAAAILLAKLVGALLARPDDYYDRDGDG